MVGSLVCSPLEVSFDEWPPADPQLQWKGAESEVNYGDCDYWMTRTVIDLFQDSHV